MRSRVRDDTVARARAWRYRRALLTGCAALAVTFALASGVTAAAASASHSSCQSPDFSEVSVAVPKSAGLISESDFPVCTTGSVAIAFRGEPSAGCVVSGVCGYSGIDSWQPGTGVLSLFVLRSHGERRTIASLDWNGTNPLLSAVQRSTPNGVSGLCQDRNGESLFGLITSLLFNVGAWPLVRQGKVAINLRDSITGAFPTRCAGRLEGDHGNSRLMSSRVRCAVVAGSVGARRAT